MNGHLTSITLGTGDTIWTLRAQNSRLLPTQVGLGGLGQSLSYDSRGNVTGRTVYSPTGSELQELHYEYSSSGNMGARSDWTHDTSEWFDYDNLNRLTDIELYSPSLGYRDRSTTYDGKGKHLPWFGLMNMNARLYDPAVGRFLSPDPLVQSPDNTQNYNRYSYCLNNPLRRTDESGIH